MHHQMNGGRGIMRGGCLGMLLWFAFIVVATMIWCTVRLVHAILVYPWNVSRHVRMRGR